MLIIYMDGQCVDGFKWVDDLSVFTENFIKNYNENSDYEAS